MSCEQCGSLLICGCRRLQLATRPYEYWVTTMSMPDRITPLEKAIPTVTLSSDKESAVIEYGARSFVVRWPVWETKHLEEILEWITDGT